MIVREFEVLNQKRYGVALKQGAQERVPVLDLEGAFKRVCAGRIMDDVLKGLAEEYMQIISSQTQDVTMNGNDFLKGLHTLVLNYEKNKDILTELPYLKINDLVVIPMAYMPDGESVPVPLEVAETIGTSGDFLLAKAMKNHMNLLPPVLIPLGNGEALGGKLVELDDKETLTEKAAIYILTNRERLYGAAAIVNKDTLALVSQKLGENFYILPCNIHTVAVIPKSCSPALDAMREIQRDVNERFVQAGVFLSEKIYYYDASRDAVKMFDGKFHEEKVRSQNDQHSR